MERTYVLDFVKYLMEFVSIVYSRVTWKKPNALKEMFVCFARSCSDCVFVTEYALEC